MPKDIVSRWLPVSLGMPAHSHFFFFSYAYHLP